MLFICKTACKPDNAEQQKSLFWLICQTNVIWYRERKGSIHNLETTCRRLATAEHQTCRRTFQVRCNSSLWKNMHCLIQFAAINDFMIILHLWIFFYSNFMHEEKIINPPGVTKVYNFMIAEHDVINRRRLDVIKQLW